MIGFALRSFKWVFRRVQFFYEALLAPFIAQYFFWVLWPIYFIIKRRKMVFVVNIADGAGHTFFELDNFFRMAYLGDIDPTKKYVWINKKNQFTGTCTKLYGPQFYWAVENTLIYNFFLPITMYYKDIVLDCGCSRLKWQLPRGLNFPYFKREKKGTYLYQIPKNLGLEQINLYYQRMKKSVGFYPLKPLEPPSKRLVEFLGHDGRKIALIHAKTVLRNATAAPTDPETYVEAIRYLQKLDYRLVFAGRESMPPIFKKLSVLDYATSPIASYENDIHLFNLSDLMIMSGSGISVVPDCLNKYFLYLNSWHLAIPAFSGKSIHVPAIIQNKEGEYLAFQEQNAIYRCMEDRGAELFPLESYRPKNATSEEILEALKELLELKENGRPMTTLQLKFRALDANAPLFFANSRCSDHFLNKYKTLL